MTQNLLTSAVVQHACCANRDTNWQRSEAGIREAAGLGAELILLPELHANVYFCQSIDDVNFQLAENLEGPTVRKFAALATELQTVIVTSIFERDAEDNFYNTAVVLDTDGRVAGSYRKMHLPDDPGYHETAYFHPGERYLPIATSVGNLGVMVCWDQWYPEAARLMALAGADLLIYPSAIGWDPKDDDAEQGRQLHAWQTVQLGHAVANSLPIMTSNRHGFEADPGDTTAGIQFWGSGFIAGPQGEVLARTDACSDSVCVAAIDLNRSAAVRKVWPLLDGRRPETYRKLVKD